MIEKWKPIDTSPRDGTKFLCYRDDGEISTAWWTGDRLGGVGWSYGEWAMPTHWRPMPKTPEVESKALYFDMTKPEEMDAAIKLVVGIVFPRKRDE